MTYYISVVLKVEGVSPDVDRETILALANALQMVLYLCPKLNGVLLNWEALKNVEKLLNVPPNIRLDYCTN